MKRKKSKSRFYTNKTLRSTLHLSQMEWIRYVYQILYPRLP